MIRLKTTIRNGANCIAMARSTNWSRNATREAKRNSARDDKLEFDFLHSSRSPQIAHVKTMTDQNDGEETRDKWKERSVNRAGNQFVARSPEFPGFLTKKNAGV